MRDTEDDGFVTVYASRTLHPLEQRCADCQQHIKPDGTGHLSWCPFWGYREFPRLFVPPRHPFTNIGE